MTTNEDSINLAAEMPESDELSRAHRVVAFPSRGRVSVREAVSSHNVKPQLEKPRPRSMSAGRTRTSPQDLVRDIYDRMGLQFKRNDPSGTVACNSNVYGSRNATKADRHSVGKDDGYRPKHSSSRSVNVNSERSLAPVHVRGERTSFEGGTSKPTDVYQDRYQSAATFSRGRNMEAPENEARRSRSLSRGRQLAKQWPPSPSHEEVLGTPTGSPARASGRIANSNVTAAVNHPPVYRVSTKEWSDEKKEPEESLSGDDLKDEMLKVTPPSVKDRASVFGGNKPKSNRNVARGYSPQYAAQGAVRERPPKVDIYGDIRRGNSEGAEKQTEEKKEDDTGRGSTGLSVNIPSAAAAVEPDAAVEYARQFKGKNRNSEGSSVTSSPRWARGTGNVGSVFLARRQKPGPQEQVIKHSSTAPMDEISASNDHAAGNDGYSVAMSSVSADEFTPSAYRFSGVTKKPAWQERNRVPAYSAGTNNNFGKNSNLSSEDIERMVDERVQTQIQNMESRMEANLSRWMNKMDEKMMARLDFMEEKINVMDSTIEYMQTHRNNL